MNQQLFSDQDRVTDLLGYEKYLASGYSTGLTESQQGPLVQELFSLLNETHLAQKQVFSLMMKKGWYELKPAQKQEIEQAKTKFSGYLSH